MNILSSAENPYANCQLCPRSCKVNRLMGETGFCGETSSLRLGAALLHFGEEPLLVGKCGSGTIFVSGCNLKCVFCQNYQISQGEKLFAEQNGAPNICKQPLGRAVSAGEFADICIALQDKGAENINIVTGSHVIPAIVEGIIEAKKRGMNLPILWNSSAYETTEALELLRDHVDIFLPDLKTLDDKIAASFFNAPDYPQAASFAILKMIDMVKRTDVTAPVNNSGTLRERVIIRHLIWPGFLDSTRQVLKWFAENAKGRAMLSLMTQYTPMTELQVSQTEKEKSCRRPQYFTSPQRYLSIDEYDTVINWLEEFNIDDGFCQELVTGNDWLPDFKRANPFSSKLSTPVWHFDSSTSPF